MEEKKVAPGDTVIKQGAAGAPLGILCREAHGRDGLSMQARRAITSTSSTAVRHLTRCRLRRNQPAHDATCALLLLLARAGTFDVLKKPAGESEEKKVFFYDNKGSFGELALMYNCPRAATVVVRTPAARGVRGLDVAPQATSEGVLWALDRATFRHIGALHGSCSWRLC